MNTRKLLTIGLLGFVIASLGWLAVRSVTAGRNWQAPDAAQAATPAQPAETPAKEPVKAPAKVIAYYFHVTVRCTTCRNIENYSKDVIHERFAQELASHRLEWRLVNVQLPENRHYIQDYQLFTKSLVLVLEQGGKEKEFKVLNDTWELVGDKAKMQKYVEKEVRDYLRKAG
jgi:hypothetical protein